METKTYTLGHLQTIATRAYNWTSFNPERRGETVVKDYSEELDSDLLEIRTEAAKAETDSEAVARLADVPLQQAVDEGQLGAGGTEGSFAGNIVNDGRFVFNRSDNYDFLGGFSGSVGYAFDENVAPATANSQITAFNLRYRGGPLDVGLGYQQQDNETATLDRDYTVLAAAYDFGAFRLEAEAGLGPLPVAIDQRDAGHRHLELAHGEARDAVKTFFGRRVENEEFAQGLQARILVGGNRRSDHLGSPGRTVARALCIDSMPTF